MLMNEWMTGWLLGWLVRLVDGRAEEDEVMASLGT